MALRRKRKKVEEPEIASVPFIEDMNDEIFLKHWNARHRTTDIPNYAIDVPYSIMTSYGYFRKFHDHCHDAVEEGSTINGERVEYNHIHEEG